MSPHEYFHVNLLFLIAHLADGLEVAEEEAVAQAEGRAGLEGREDLLVQLRLFQSSQRNNKREWEVRTVKIEARRQTNARFVGVRGR
jgi:hypothetical protein